MKSKYNPLTCLFGHHQYSNKSVKGKDGIPVHICVVCRRSGRGTWGSRGQVWVDYDKKGNIIHRKWCGGLEVWNDHDKKGNVIHRRWSCGEEAWYDKKGNIIRKKLL